MIRLAAHTLAALLLLVSLGTIDAWSSVERVVILKADGLPFDVLDSFVRTKDAYTGKSVLPWLDHVFYQRGARVRNFYSRGLSLSAPSWALLDTGQPSVIKGNLEFDRLTLHSYDYLNVFSHVLKSTAGGQSVTSGVRVIDEQGLPLLSDAYGVSERHVSGQLFVRGLPGGLGTFKRLLTLRNPKEWLDEWTMGFERESILFEVLERDLLSKLKNPKVRYFDFMIPVFDHAVHLNREPEALFRALQQIDQVVGRVWTAIEKTSLSDQTVLVLVSDHGMNTDSRVYSQGYNLIDLFTSPEGGAHHVVTNRPPLGEYSFKSLSPTVPLITTTSTASYYLKGQAGKYPTLLLDADGNERASIYLRDSELNLLHILWQQLIRKDLRPEFQRAAKDAFFLVRDRNRENWTILATQLQQELGALQRRIQQSNMSNPSIQAVKLLKSDESKYSAYLVSLKRLIALEPATFDPSRLKIDEVLARNSVGTLNSIYDLQNYAVGLSKDGLSLNDDGSLDMTKSFIRVNYPSVLEQIRAQNNVQPSVASHPVDFVAAAIPAKTIAGALPADLLPVDGAVWLYRDDARQALILSRRESDGRVRLRYLPVRELTQSIVGQVQFLPSTWQEKLPLELWEDLQMPEDQRRVWLDSWHEESEWMEAFHSSRYSNAVISIYEHYTFSPMLRDPSGENLTDDDLLLRFRNRRRFLAQADFVIFANDHWNFNYRGFNPGGNHGAFFRKSTRATLMFAGGPDTGIPGGLSIAQPYDALSLAPTIFRLTGELTEEGLSRNLVEKGFTPFPGPVIRELFETAP